MFGRAIFIKKYILVGVFCSVVLALPISYGLFLIHQTQEEATQKSLCLAEKLQKELEDIFEEDQKILSYLGSIILNQNMQQNPQAIASLLTTTGDLRLNTLATSYVSWANASGQIIVSGQDGVITHNPKNIQSRPYFQTCRAHPWTLKVSPITQSFFSSRFVLPTAMGVKSAEKFEGYLILGLRLDELQRILSRKFKEPGYVFLMLDENAQFVLSSDSLLRTFSHEISQKFQKESDPLKAPLVLQGIKAFLKGSAKVDGFPYTVITGYQQSAFHHILFLKLAPVVCFIFLFLSACLLLFWGARHSFILPLRNFCKSFEALIGDSGNQSQISIKTSFEYLDSLLQNLETKKYALEKQERVFVSSFQALEKYLKDTQRALEAFLLRLSKKVMAEKISYSRRPEDFLDNLTAELNSFLLQGDYHEKKTSFDMNVLLQECQTIYEKIFLEKNLSFSLHHQSTLPLYYGSPLKIKKIILTLLQYSVERSLSEGLITLNTRLITDKKGTFFIQICIEDNGLDENLVRTLEKKLARKQEATNYGYCRTLKEVGKLVGSEEGSFKCFFPHGKGRKYTLLLPIPKEEKHQSLLRKGSLLLITGGD